MKLQYCYKQARERGNNATSAITIARRYISGTLTDYRAKLAAWEAEPDKRRYAPGGFANRPKFPSLYAPRDPEDYAPDGYRVFGFAKGNSSGAGLTDEPDFGFYADEHCDITYYPCVLIRRTNERHVWACVAAYWDDAAQDFIVDNTRARDFARSDELFDESEYRQGSPVINWYDLCQDARDALRRAINLAESDAEDAREHDAKWQEASRHNDERDDARCELKDARQVARDAIAALREQRALSNVAPKVCELLRATIATARADMRRAIARIESETAAIAELGMAGEF